MNLSQANTRRLSIGLTMGALVALGLLLYKPVFGDLPRALITDRIDEGHLVTLAHNTRREASPENDRGPVPDDFPLQHMLLQLKRSPVMEAELVQYVGQLTDKSSPNFRHWLTPQQIGDRYGMTRQDMDTIKSWLTSHGLTVGYTYPTRMVMDISGTAGQIREAFHTEIHYYEVNGKAHFANATDPRIPAALTPAVLGVVSMHDFMPRPHILPRLPMETVTASTGGTFHLIAPGDVETIYNLNPVYRQGIYGQGQTIVVVEDAMPWNSTSPGSSPGGDPTTYQTVFGLTKYGGTWSNIHPNDAGNCTAPASPNGDEGEANIDVESALSVAPAFDAPFAGVIQGGAGMGGLAAIRGELDNPAAALLAQVGECRAHHPDRAEQVGADLLGDLFVRQRLGCAEEPVARVVHDHVDLAEVGESLIYDLLNSRQVGHVELGEPKEVAMFALRSFIESILRTVPATRSPRSRSCSVI